MTDGNVVRSDAPGGLSRRTLVAGAAWSVPVVVGLAALPAVAASGDRARLRLNTHSVYATYDPGNPARIGVGYELSLVSDYINWQVNPIVTKIQLYVSLPAVYFSSSVPTSITQDGGTGSWSYKGRSNGTGATVVFEFEWSGTLLQGTSGTPKLNFRIRAISSLVASVETTVTASSPQQDPVIGIVDSPYTATV